MSLKRRSEFRNAPEDTVPNPTIAGIPLRMLQVLETLTGGFLLVSVVALLIDELIRLGDTSPGVAAIVVLNGLLYAWLWAEAKDRAKRKKTDAVL